MRWFPHWVPDYPIPMKWGVFMNIDEIKGWLEEEYLFTDVEFKGKITSGLLFQVKDEEGANAHIQFEAEPNLILVTGRFAGKENWVILDRLFPETKEDHALIEELLA